MVDSAASGDGVVEAVVAAAVARYSSSEGPLLQILHAVQDTLNHIPPAAVPLIARSLNLSRAEVHGVVTFYHFFRQHPRGRHVVQVCQAEACRSMHCEQLTERAKTLLGIDFHQTTADGRYTLEPVYCLGNCACAPSVMIDGELHGRVTPEHLPELLSAEALP
ncbi:formate dehydrogenase subunit gamma [Povalibacter sp.]|uniref:formate dehydrogenase subunit gamma n=1 Tax=Povalibacter sp. TaxID=1962978 RepID=UPI0039C8E4AC